MTKNWWDYVASVLKPSYWLMLYKVSPRWDARLLQLLAKHKFTDYDDHTVKLGEFTLWIANHPYGSFMPHSMEGLPEDIRARRSTIHYAKRMMKVDLGVIDSDPYPVELKEVEELRKMFEESK